VLTVRVDRKRMCEWWDSYSKIQKLQPKNKLKQIGKGNTGSITYEDDLHIRRKYF
jgi:hypothetical protein